MGWTKNFGKPEGVLGKMILNSMNSGHTPISKWGLSHYEWKPDTVALDIGCGGGMNVKRMLKLCPQGKAAGIDISDESVRKSKQVNCEFIGKRCDIKKEVQSLFHTGTADLMWLLHLRRSTSGRIYRKHLQKFCVY